jgi:2,4-dienoyl-CoA reductase (NADPH2)
LETVRAVRSALGSDFPILYRLSAADFAEGGVDLSLTVPFAQELEKAGVDCIDVSAGTPDSPDDHASHPGTHASFGCFKDLAAAVKEKVGIPVIAVGKIATKEVAESILEENMADLIALGRPLIADPDWTKKVKEGEGEAIVPCIWDNGGCLNKTIMKGRPIRCVQNSSVGFEHEGTKT